jgi:hypothetical protein
LAEIYVTKMSHVNGARRSAMERALGQDMEFLAQGIMYSEVTESVAKTIGVTGRAATRARNHIARGRNHHPERDYPQTPAAAQS